MTHLIDKDALVAELKRQRNVYIGEPNKYKVLSRILSFIDTLEVKKNNSQHLQSNEDIYDSFNDWNMHSFICLMNDETVREFTGILAECYDGSINKHIHCVDDDYDWEFDDIMYWIEMPLIEEKETDNENK